MKLLKHIIPWAIFFIGTTFLIRTENDKVTLEMFIRVQLLLMIVTLVIFYLNYFIFVPKLLIEKKRFQFISSIGLLIIIANFLSFLVKNYYDYTQGSEFLSINNLSYKNIINNTMTAILVVLISTGVRLISQYQKDKANRAELKEIVQKAELEALKAQINPHFLYNSFNTLYALAKMKSDKTAGAILQLSDIMRYVTYQSSQKKVSISEELNFINSYISFQKLRVSEPDMKIVTDIKIPENDFSVSPLLLISFVENAFKHSNLLKSDTFIKIIFEPHPTGFKYIVSNTIGSNEITNSGVGLKTLKKILDFTYPNSHRLELNIDNNIHYAVLHLNLKK